MKVVIIAGGKGTRIASVNSEIPKAMIPVNGKPVLEYQIELAYRYGLKEITLIIGYLGDQIKSYFGNGSKWNVTINYFEEAQPLGTAGAIAELSDTLTEDFLVFYGDTIMDIDLNRMINFHKNHPHGSTLLVHPNDHPFDSDLVEIDDNHCVRHFHSKPHPENFIYKNLVNAALYILTPELVSLITPGEKSDFGKDIFPLALKQGINLFGYVSPEYIKDMGTPDRYQLVCGDVLSGKVQSLNLNNKRKAIFLDRDGVINKEVDLLHEVEKLELIEGVAEAVRLINKMGYLTIVITNQPVIARNLCSIEVLQNIHKKMETLLGEKGAYLDGIYYCPHHPDKGYPEERVEYKIACDCRKPKPGMILSAAKDFNIDLPNSYLIGDRLTDIEAGTNAGLKKSFQIETNKPNVLLELIKTF